MNTLKNVQLHFQGVIPGSPGRRDRDPSEKVTKTHCSQRIYEMSKLLTKSTEIRSPNL